MKIEDFGFQPVMGKDYVVSFTKDGEVLSTSIYNGSPLPAVNFPDNAKINLTITDKETGKQLQSSEFISYNGKLYKSVFALPLKNENTNKNANIYIKDLHYDLTTGSVLVQVQGFSGDQYKLLVADSTLKHKVVAMPITLEDDIYYSVPTELVQGNKFEVTLQDQHGKSIDMQEFTAPISTDWRYTETVEDGTLQLDELVVEQPVPPVDVPGQGQTQQQLPTTQESTEQKSLLPEAMVPYKNPILIGSGILVLILILVIITRFRKRRNAQQEWETDEDYEDFHDEAINYDELESELEEVSVYDEESEESGSDKKNPKK